MIWMTRYHFEDRIMKKPDWKDAPDWADVLVIGKHSGKYAWFSGKKFGKGIYADGSKARECNRSRFRLVENRPIDRQHPAAAHAIEWPEDDRIEIVGQNGNEGLQYDPADVAFKSDWKPIRASSYPKYVRDVSDLEWIDVYSVCQLFGVDDTSGATHHAIKKLLLSGTRNGGKSKAQDIIEARDTLNRLIEILGMDAQ